MVQPKNEGLPSGTRGSGDEALLSGLCAALAVTPMIMWTGPPAGGCMGRWRRWAYWCLSLAQSIAARSPAGDGITAARRALSVRPEGTQAECLKSAGCSVAVPVTPCSRRVMVVTSVVSSSGQASSALTTVGLVNLMAIVRNATGWERLGAVLTIAVNRCSSCPWHTP